jgi:hypothetical protein
MGGSFWKSTLKIFLWEEKDEKEIGEGKDE